MLLIIKVSFSTPAFQFTFSINTVQKNVFYVLHNSNTSQVYYYSPNYFKTPELGCMSCFTFVIQ